MRFLYKAVIKMKRIFIACIILITFLLIISCKNSAKDSLSNKDIEETTTNKNEIYNTQLKYLPHYINTIEELIDWINSIDIENFEEGRWKEFITQIRNDGEILLPTYKQEKVQFINHDIISNIVISPEQKYEDSRYGFACFLGNEKCYVGISYINKNYQEDADKSISEYIKNRFKFELPEGAKTKTKVIKTSESEVEAYITEGVEASKSKVEFFLQKKIITVGFRQDTINEDLIKDIDFMKIKLSN